MATKAELQAELAELKRAMKQDKEQAGSADPDVSIAQDKAPASGPDTLQELLDELGLNAKSLETFKTNLVGEVTELQKEKPLVTLVAAVALGIVIGRAFK